MASEVTRAWKFLDERSRGLFSERQWPRPGPDGPGSWVEAAGPIEACVQGVHACRADHLAWWLSAQLWEIELDGEQLVTDYSLVAARGRLVRPVEGWPQVGSELARWALDRSRDRAVDALAPSNPGGAAALAAATDPAAVAERAAVLAPGLDGRASSALAFLTDNLGDGTNPVPACHTSARGAAVLASFPDHDPQQFRPAFAAERQAQSRWLAARLELTPAP